MGQLRLFSVVLALGMATAMTVQAEDHSPKEGLGAEEIESGGDDVVGGKIVQKQSGGEVGLEQAGTNWDYPQAYAARPLTMQKRMLRGTFGINVSKGQAAGGKAIVSLDFGAAFSPLDDLEVGISNYRLGARPPLAGQGLFPIIVAPDADFGDMPLYARYTFFNKKKVSMAGDVVFVIPSNTDFAFTLGLPVRVYSRDNLTLDTGAEFTILANDAGLNLNLPIKVTFNISDPIFVFGGSGIEFQNLGRSGYGSNVNFPVDNNQVFLPLFFGGGYTMKVKDKVMMDMFAQFGWNPFLYFNPPSGVNVVPAGDAWFLGIGVNVYTRPLGKNKPPKTKVGQKIEEY